MKLIARRTFPVVIVAAVLALAVLMTMGTALANAKAPTNGGNGAGKSGQCTGSSHDRPTSCQSPGGVSEK